MVECDWKKKQVHYHPMLKGIRTEHLDSNQYSFEFSFFNMSDNYIFYSSWNSDKIYVYDYRKKERMNDIQVNSDYTNIGGDAFYINHENMQNKDALRRQRGAFNGLINRFFYDEKRKLLYVLVFHEQKDLDSDIYGATRPWSLIVFNDKFEKVYEEAFEHGEYSMGFAILTSKGLMVRKYDKEQHEHNKRSDDKIFTFDVFDFHI